MKEKSLLYVSIICSLVGLALLYFLSQTIELKATDIKQITADDVGKNVKVCGNITSKFVSNNKHVFLKIEDTTGRIDAVVFNSTAESFGAYDVGKGDEVCIIGQVSEYQNGLEIIVKEKIESFGE